MPTPPFWGDRIVKGIALADVVGYLDERATFMGQWGLKGSRTGPSYEELVEVEGRPRLRAWLDRIHTEGVAEFAVVYGYWPCYSEGNDLVVLRPDGEVADPAAELHRFSFPRQRRPRYLCLADFFRDRALAEAQGPDVVAFHLVTMGSAVSRVTATLFEQNAYRDYLELHGLSVQLTEALAELWHARVRSDLGFTRDDGDVRRHDPGPGLPRLALLLRLSGLPGPGGPDQAGGPAPARNGSGSSCPRSCSCTRSSPPTR